MVHLFSINCPVHVTKFVLEHIGHKISRRTIDYYSQRIRSIIDKFMGNFLYKLINFIDT